MSRANPRAFERVAGSAVDALADTVRAHADDLKATPFVAGVMIEDVALPAAATTTISHGLGRVPICCVAIWAEGGLPSFYVQAANAKQISLTSANACTVTLWVA